MCVIDRRGGRGRGGPAGQALRRLVRPPGAHALAHLPARASGRVQLPPVPCARTATRASPLRNSFPRVCCSKGQALSPPGASHRAVDMLPRPAFRWGAGTAGTWPTCAPWTWTRSTPPPAWSRTTPATTPPWASVSLGVSKDWACARAAAARRDAWAQTWARGTAAAHGVGRHLSPASSMRSRAVLLA